MSSPTPGITLGSYRITEQIGTGGMATVFKAWHSNTNRHVAIKVLPDHLSRDPQFIARFNQEVRIIARLEHRNILPVYGFGEENGTAYMVMRYLDGGTLGEILAQGRVGMYDTIEIIIQICAALDYAHRQGVVHRDIKPANIMIDSEGLAYLTDFGIAKVLESTEGLTQDGVAIGTPEYMAPEQALGAEVDGRIDIYALGIILYQLAVGNIPYYDKTPMAVALAHIHDPLPLPSQVNPKVPKQIELIILKALAKDANNRYQTASEMAQALKNIIHSSQTAEVKLSDLGGNLPSLIEKIQDSRPVIPVADIPPGTYAWQTPQPASTVKAPRRKLPLPPAIMAVIGMLGVVGLIWLGSSFLQNMGTTTPTRLPPPTSDDPGGASLTAGNRLYDDFDLAEHDGSINARNWRLDTQDGPNCEVFQQDSTLHIVNQPGNGGESFCNLYIASPPSMNGPRLESLEAQMQMLDDHNSEPISATLRVQTTYGEKTWSAECGVAADPDPVFLMQVDDSRQPDGEPAYMAEQPVEYNTWYTVRLNIDVQAFTVSCLLDGDEIGSYAPQNVNDFVREEFDRLIASWGEEGAAGTILVNDFTKILP